MTTPLDAALSYLAKGWSVIPILAGTKRPPLPWKDFQTRRATVEEVRGWFARWPDAGVAIVCGAVSGLVVVDRDGDAGAENLTARGISYPDTPRVRTRRGEHVYFAHPGAPVESRANPDNDRVRAAHPTLAGLDWKGDGGYVLAPPTVHPEGPVYAWDVTPDAAPLAPLPEWFWQMYAEAHEDRGARMVTVETPTLPPDPHEPPGYAHIVADVLPLLREARDASRGGVPLPRAWECMAAVLGGMTRKALQDTHRSAYDVKQRRASLDPATPFNTHREAGRYLPAGLHTITGQTGGGKTAAVVNLAYAALRARHPVVYVSLELDAPELAARLLALEAELPWSALALRRPMNHPDAIAKRDAGITALTDPARRFVALVPDGNVGFSALATNLRATVLRVWADTDRKRAPLVIFDYLQAAGILSPGGAQRESSLREHIAAVAMELRRLSREQLPDAPDWPGCPVVALSLTARTNVAGKEKIAGFGSSPDLLRRADLEALKALPKEAGEVEGSAVTAWVMALGEDAHGTGERPLTLRLAKNRIGPDGQWVPFVFDGKTGALREAPERYEAAAREDAENAERKQLEHLKAQKEQKEALEKLRKEFGPQAADFSELEPINSAQNWVVE